MADKDLTDTWRLSLLQTPKFKTGRDIKESGILLFSFFYKIPCYFGEKYIYLKFTKNQTKISTL